MTPTQIEAEILKQMKLLKITREEATELVMEDLEVDKMSMTEVQNDLTAEQKKAIKANTKTTSGEKKERKPRERKVDEVKVNFIGKLYDYLFEDLAVDAPKIVKPEKEITFRIGEDDYSLTLTKHRKPKAPK